MKIRDRRKKSVEQSDLIRAKIRKDRPEIGDHELNLMVGIFALANVYNNEQGGHIPFGESMVAVLDKIADNFCDEDMYAYVVRKMAEMQEEPQLIVTPGSTLIQ